MNWLTEGTTWDVVQEWRRRFPHYDGSRVPTPDMRAVLAGTKIIAKYKRGFVVMTKEELDKRNAEVQEFNRMARARAKRLRQQAQARLNNDPVTKDLAESLAWLRDHVIKHINEEDK